VLGITQSLSIILDMTRSKSWSKQPKRSRKVIITMTVQEILEEQDCKKVGVIFMANLTDKNGWDNLSTGDR
jgi:hypothetical protein